MDEDTKREIAVVKEYLELIIARSEERRVGKECLE